MKRYKNDNGVGVANMADEEKDLSKSEAYKVVFDDLTKCNMFKGIYDAKHGNPDFMYGILTIMENIALNISEDCYEKFTTEFTKNMTESKHKTGYNESEE